MSVQKWLRKRKACVFPEYVVREYVQYHKWARRTWRALSLQQLRTSPDVVASSSCDGEEHDGGVWLRQATPPEVLAAEEFFGVKASREVWLHYQPRHYPYQPGPEEAMLFRFDFTMKKWRYERYNRWLEIDTDTKVITCEIARCQLAPVRRHFRLPAVLCDLITNFLLEAVPDELLSRRQITQ
jgi:hypothetical protein